MLPLLVALLKSILTELTMHAMVCKDNSVVLMSFRKLEWLLRDNGPAKNVLTGRGTGDSTPPCLIKNVWKYCENVKYFLSNTWNDCWVAIKLVGQAKARASICACHILSCHCIFVPFSCEPHVGLLDGLIVGILTIFWNCLQLPSKWYISSE